MGFFRFGKKLRPKYFFGLSTHIIFVGESIKSGGQVVAHHFFWPSLRIKFLTLFVNFEMEKFVVFKSSFPVNKAWFIPY